MSRTIDPKLCEFMAQYTDDETTREVLQLLGRHPRTRLSRLAIRHGVEWGRSDVDRALKTLISRKIVKTGHENGQAVFSLTSEEPQHGLAVKMANLDLAQWRAMLKRASLPLAILPAYKSSLNAREREILAAFRHQSAFVLPVMPRFTKG